jgi:hypothetical protein
VIAIAGKPAPAFSFSHDRPVIARQHQLSVSIETGKFCIYPASNQLTTITSNAANQCSH